MVNYAKEFKDAIESKDQTRMRNAMVNWQSDLNAEDDANYWLAFSMVCSLSDMNENATKAIYKANSLIPNDSDLHIGIIGKLMILKLSPVAIDSIILF